MTPVVTIVTPQLGGLHVIHPTAANFEQQLTALYGKNSALVAELSPYVVMLSNESAHGVIAYTIVTKFLAKDGDVREQPCLYAYPDAVSVNAAMPRGREIYPGEKRVVTLDYWEIDPTLDDLDFFLRQHVGILKWGQWDTVSHVEVIGGVEHHSRIFICTQRQGRHIRIAPLHDYRPAE